MADMICVAGSGECVLVANTAKTILQIKAATNQRVKVSKLELWGKQPAGGTDTPVKIRVTRSTANFGTFTTGTPGKLDPSNPETIQTTVGQNASVEPTSPTDTSYWIEFSPQSGVINPQAYSFEWKIPGGQALNIEATSTGTPTIVCDLTFEE